MSTSFADRWADAWSQNGVLLACAAGLFDAFVTVDRNRVFQQRVENLPFAVIVLRAPLNRFVDLRPLVPLLLQTLIRIKPGEIKWVESDSALVLN